MRLYQEDQATVKGSVAIIDAEALMTRASEGLLQLSVELGWEVLRQMLETDATEPAGPKGKDQEDRKAYRHGTEKSRVVLGGEKVPVERPRVRSIDNKELALPSLELFQREDPLNRALLARLLCGVSTRKYGRTVDAPGCVSKSAASRRFAAGLEAQMEVFFKRPIEGRY